MIEKRIPYGRQSIDESDIAAVVDVLQSDWLTTGPMVAAFEQAMAEYVGAKYAVAVSSGTAALHATMFAAGISAGDEVIVPTMTFVATANAVVYQGGTPILVDVRADNLLIDIAAVEAKIGPRTKAIAAVDYAGHPCDYDALWALADRHGLILIADACHALGATYRDCSVGTLADMTVFSFHPVKHITTGEGGMILTDDSALATKMKQFRNHGITSDHRDRSEKGSWHYEMVDLGYNYRITDFQCALGLSQLKKLPAWLDRRRQIAAKYDEAFANIDGLRPLTVLREIGHAYHLYVVVLDAERVDRSRVFSMLLEAGVGVNVHYIPVHHHPYYQQRFGYKAHDCPVASAAYEQLLSLPMFPAMSDEDVDFVINAVNRTLLQVL